MKGKPPFRADHVGSLLRPIELIEARHKLRDKKIGEDALHEIEDRAIRNVVKLQESIGLEVVTDGEFRRGAFFSHFVKAVDGMTVKETPFMFNDSRRQRSVLCALHRREVEAKEWNHDR